MDNLNNIVNKGELEQVKKFAEKTQSSLQKKEEAIKSGQSVETNVHELGELFSKFSIKREFIFPSNGHFGYKSVPFKPLVVADELAIREDISHIYRQAFDSNSIKAEYSYYLFNKILELSIDNTDKSLIYKLSLNDYISFLFFIFLFNTPKKQIVIEDTTYSFDNLEMSMLESNTKEFIEKQLEMYDIENFEVKQDELNFINIGFPDKGINFIIDLTNFFKNHKEVVFISPDKLEPSKFVTIKVNDATLSGQETNLVIKQTEMGKYIYTILSTLSSGTDGFKLYYGMPSILKIGEDEVAMDKILSSFFRRIVHT